jgi:hypothetical protein
MNLIVYPRLSTRSRRAMLRLKRRSGKPCVYTPHGDLLDRLVGELKLSKEQVLEQIKQERQYLIKVLS